MHDKFVTQNKGNRFPSFHDVEKDESFNAILVRQSELSLQVKVRVGMFRSYLHFKEDFALET